MPEVGEEQLAEFDGSVVVERTAGEVSARCHEEQANFLALNLMHDIVTGAKNVQEARDYSDVCILSDEDLQNAAREGEDPPERAVRGAASERENR